MGDINRRAAMILLLRATSTIWRAVVSSCSLLRATIASPMSAWEWVRRISTTTVRLIKLIVMTRMASCVARRRRPKLMLLILMCHVLVWCILDYCVTDNLHYTGCALRTPFRTIGMFQGYFTAVGGEEAWRGPSPPLNHLQTIKLSWPALKPACTAPNQPATPAFLQALNRNQASSSSSRRSDSTFDAPSSPMETP